MTYYRYVKSRITGEILDCEFQAKKYGLTLEEYHQKFSFPDCIASNYIEDLFSPDPED